MKQEEKVRRASDCHEGLRSSRNDVRSWSFQKPLL